MIDAEPTPASPTLSVIVPCWNDASALEKTLSAIRNLDGVLETIVSDATAGDDCAHIATQFSATVVRNSVPNRGRQMNAGAAIAAGDIFLFHHADSDLTQAHISALRTAMADRAIAGGAFHRKFDTRHRIIAPFEPVSRILGKLGGTLYGDQSIFVRRAIFRALGGFADMPLMEDVEFSKRLRRFGRTIVLDPPMISSARRHAKNGAWRTSLQNAALIVLYKCGASPERLHQFYYK
ncbi:MAG: TIGR04283 family arsenosugar biosynthesis glycosyltransferase [Verrucomicrobiota bacterium]|nr:TIGR04283 family arsenosugar biosynthesis glycosyltransferase [Verrucomicrobiota bacterium]